jgi:hypothetical protein
VVGGASQALFRIILVANEDEVSVADKFPVHISDIITACHPELQQLDLELQLSAKDLTLRGFSRGKGTALMELR